MLKCPSLKFNFRTRIKSWSRKFALLLTITAMLAIIFIILALVISIHFTDSCIEVGLPTNLTVNSSGEITRISWNPPEEQRNCYVYYSLFYRIDGNDKVHVQAVHTTHYDIPRIKPCSTLAVQIHGVSGSSGELTETYVFQQYSEVPETISAPGIQHSQHKEGIIIEWSKPGELENCRIHYMLDIKTDFGHIRKYTIIHEYFILQDYTYCFKINLDIATIYAGKHGPPLHNMIMLPEEPLNLQSELQGTKLTVKWQRHSKHALCALTYVVIYEAEEQKTEKKEVKQLVTNFEIKYCLYGSVTLMVPYGNFSYNYSINASYWPEEVEPPSNIQITMKGETRVAKWQFKPLYDHCRFNYEIQLISDVGVFKHSMLSTKKKLFDIPSSEYCFKLKLKIRAILLHIITPQVTSNSTNIATHPPSNLNVVASTWANTLTVSWDDSKRKLCKLTYTLKYTIGTDVSEMEVDGLQKVLSLEYCTIAKIGVISHDSNPPSVEILITHSEGDPKKLGPVQKLSVSVDETVATVKWDPPQHVKHCKSLSYNVTGINAAGVTNSCDGTSTCDIELPKFCPHTTFNIRSITVPESAVTTYEYTCPTKRLHSLQR